MKLDPAAFNRFLGQVGQDVRWRRAYACPCVNPNSGQPKANCPLCSSKGRIWDPALPSKVGIAGRNAHKQWSQMGISDAGDVLLSIPSDSVVYNIGQFDRVVLANRSEPFSVNLVKNMNDRIRFKIISVDRVMWLNQAGALVDGVLPTVKADGTLDWSAGAPPAGVTYSLSGRREQEFFCYYEMPFDRPHHAGAALPRSVVLRRFELYGNGG